MKTSAVSLAMSLLGLSAAPMAAAGHDHHGVSLEKCLAAAQQVKSGDVLKVEYLTIRGDYAYEIEIRDSGGVEWEFICDKDDGAISEIEQEAGSVDDARFKKNAKISEDQATATVTALYPGTVEEVEYEIEDNGDPSYEIDVVDSAGKELKVEVDAATGKIIEVSIEHWEIGEEASERK
ncbi:MAG: PepSY domain-containing protein [Chromatiales bacterium]